MTFLICFASCNNSAGSGSGGSNPEDDQFKINYSLGEPPKSEELTKDKYSIDKGIAEGIYITFDIPEAKNYWTTRVYIEGLGAVAEEVQYTDERKTKGCFFYPFVEAGKEYTIRFVFLRKEDKNEDDFVIDYQGDDGSIGWFETKVTAGPQSKGEVRLTSKGKIDVKKNGDFKFTEKPMFQNENLLGGKWEVDIGLVEGVSWAHVGELRTKWHDIKKPIPSTELTTPINLYKDQKEEEIKDKYSIDFICVRPILHYEYNGKTYKYQWESFVQDIYYPPRNPDGIYLELDFPKSKFSRCDINIDGIGKVAEEMKPLDKSNTKGCFFYPFLEADKEYTIHFSFKKPDQFDDDGFIVPIKGDDTITEVTKKVTAGPRAKGEVRLLNKGGLKVDSKCNILYFVKPEFKNKDLLGNKWMIGIGLMEGISWDHGDERRTKWHCEVTLSPKNFDANSDKSNLRELDLVPYDQCNHDHHIDCLCVRPIMFYEYGGEKYRYMWDGYTSDVHYPLNKEFEEIDISKADKIYGTWTRERNWDDTENFLAKVHTVFNEKLVINNNTVKQSWSYTHTKLNGSEFTKEEAENIMVDDSKYFSYDISNDGKTITEKYESNQSLSQHFASWEYDNRIRHYELKLAKDENELWIFNYGTDNGQYYEWTDVYHKQ